MDLQSMRSAGLPRLRTATVGKPGVRRESERVYRKAKKFLVYT
jgi:hypothetical protein